MEKMNQIKIEKSDREYFTVIPNIVDDLELSPYAFRLYAHIKRIAGETGACWQSTRTLAEQCFMSASTVSRAKKELQEWNLITVTLEKSEHGGMDYHLIKINDIWKLNSSKEIREDFRQLRKERAKMRKK